MGNLVLAGERGRERLEGIEMKVPVNGLRAGKKN
jgi:hypothetical protein